MATNKILLLNSDRLGIKDSTTIQKAETFLRVLNSKTGANAISETGKVVLCLDLAATIQGVGFDKSTALKLTAYRKGVYSNHLNIIEKILNLDKAINVDEVCVQLGCSEAIHAAQIILKNYEECDTKIKDIEHPQYVAAAVYTSCKLNDIKVDKPQLKSISRLKTAQWNELLEEFSKFAITLGIVKHKKCAPKRNTVLSEHDLMNTEDEPNINTSVGNQDMIEDYETWRERILKEAAAKILEEEIMS